MKYKTYVANTSYTDYANLSCKSYEEYSINLKKVSFNINMEAGTVSCIQSHFY